MDLVESYHDDLRFARSGRTWALLAMAAAALVAFPWLAPASWTLRATLVWLYAVGVMGQGLLIAHTGQVSFGQAGFMAIGAFCFAHLRHAGVPVLPALVAGGTLAALFGLALGFPALRLKGPYLAIATLAFGVAVYQVLTASETLSGGRTGLSVPRLEPMLGLERGTTVYYAYLALLLAFMAATYNLISSHVGRAFAAVRDSDVAAETLGVSARNYKLLAFALSSFYTGVQGALLVQLLGHAEPQSFTLAESITMFVAVVVGGAFLVEGALFGAAFVVLVPLAVGGSGWAVPVTFGAALILVTLWEPRGLAGLWLRLRSYVEAWPFR
jgi:branched-chain amino acid transport system permease protein